MAVAWSLRGAGSRRWLPWLLLAPVLVYLAIFYIAPLGIVVVASVRTNSSPFSHHQPKPVRGRAVS